MDEVDELFGDHGGQPEPRTMLILSLLTSGLLLTLFGLACSAAPGGLVVLAGWVAVEKEMGRVESGYLPADTRPQVRSLQIAAQVAVTLVLLLFVLQTVLLSMGVYEALLVQVLETLLSWTDTSVVVPPPTPTPAP
jgi:hypothetical protein